MPDPQLYTFAVFIFMFGACVGSFLNVVVYRMPRDLSIVSPPSACPKCGHRLSMFDNVPILGWLWLRGKCRYCRNPISPRYPIVEFITAIIFICHFFLLFRHGWGPYSVVYSMTIYGTVQREFHVLSINNDWPVLVMHLLLIGALLAASMIDWEHYIIPLEICWTMLGIGIVGHAFLRGYGELGSLHFSAAVNAGTLGAAIGLLIALALLRAKLIQRSFEDDAPLLEKDLAELPEDQRPDAWPPARIRAEIRREMLFVLFPIALAALAVAIEMTWPTLLDQLLTQEAVSGALGALCGGFVGAAVVWLFRIVGSYAFGREAMGLGDVHFMLGIGAIIGPGAATVVFFIAPAFALIVAVGKFLLKGQREISFGPYLSMATYTVLLFYTPIAEYLAPAVLGLGYAAQSITSGSNSGISGSSNIVVPHVGNTQVGNTP